MAAAFGQSLGTTTTSVNATSLALTTTAATVSGEHVFVYVHLGHGDTTPTCADNQSSTYTRVKTHVGSSGVHLFKRDQTTALASGAIITASWTTSGRANMGAFTATGIGAMDSESTGRTQFNTTTWASNACTTTTAGCFVIGVADSWAPTDTTVPTHSAAAGWTNVANPSNSSNRNLIAVYKVGGAAGAETAGGTWSVSQAGGEQDSFAIAYAASGASAPANTVAPAVTGNKYRTQTLTTDDGTWTGSPAPTFTYQWQRDNSGGGTFSNIAGATANTRVIDANDVGCQLRCVVTGTNASGSASANSNAVTVGDLYTGPPAGSGRVEVCGNATVAYTGEMALAHIQRSLLFVG